jgi:excisionase family DNA binding protein
MLDADTQPPFLTVAEVARYLRVSETTVWRWCTSGKLPAFRIGRSWRVRRDDLGLMIDGVWPQQKPGEELVSVGALPTTADDA